MFNPPPPPSGFGSLSGPSAPQPGQFVPQVAAPFGVAPNGVPYSERQKIVAGLLQIFLGYFGVGRFYTGHTNLGVAQFAACAVAGILAPFTCGLSMLALLWPFVDGIVMMVSSNSRDAQGNMLR